MEWVGYAASLFIVLSLTMTSIIKLRIINSIGCLLFIIYGLNLNAYPVVISNALIVMINIYNLYMLSKGKKQ
ncbi:MAG TPA: lactate dehydrogenase [Romboutsia timonensis]|uniref:Lactate dehydrogenase n=1 Tax=Romboutsia timonensis TaxID=1776391 RepID=A0A921SYS4_9FIRM|nr:lactate dehydrogenase [Romboutsia timonensis]